MGKLDVELFELKRLIDKMKALKANGMTGLEPDIRRLEQLYQTNQREAAAINQMRFAMKDVQARAPVDDSASGDMQDRFGMNVSMPGASPVIGVPGVGQQKARTIKRKRAGAKKGARPRNPKKRKR